MVTEEIFDLEHKLSVSARSQVNREKKVNWVSNLSTIFSIYYLFFWWDWYLNSGLHDCKAGALPLEPHLQSILLWLFWTWGSCKPAPGESSVLLKILQMGPGGSHL
jgi:hypothetical protein